MENNKELGWVFTILAIELGKANREGVYVDDLKEETIEKR